MNLNCFFSKRKRASRPSPADILKQFATELDQQITELGLDVMNHPGVTPRNF